jgi:hypothetical protein
MPGVRLLGSRLLDWPCFLLLNFDLGAGVRQ